ncbi:hypothetical protein [Paenibacillus apiarius]|uniref:hypothetical protein n=1 Tax=Paenibacillus apiarius TaxID=46240 RepID=UPI003B3B35C3
MNDRIYVTLVDGYPRMKDGAIRTYKTRERAEKEILALSKYPSYRDCVIEVGIFAVTDLKIVGTKEDAE